MSLEYSITYKAENTYENWVHDAYWQFLIIPQLNRSQEFVEVDFRNSINAINEHSINGYGFQTIRIHPKKKFKSISFIARFKLLKKDINPFDFEPEQDHEAAYKTIEALEFRVNHAIFLKTTPFTAVPSKKLNLYTFNKEYSIFENLQHLNRWTSEHLLFKTDVTDVYSTLDEVLQKRQGVCQDFTHLFCALARLNGIPTRYISGYLHQGNGYFGDSQMHAWAEAYIPKIGWVGFDPTNNILANSNHIKVAHGKDFKDCSALKGIVYSIGTNKTRHSVEVQSTDQ
ncbi:transglutaminase-like domain-containing protein [Pareuzebyella sediminis]|uniref:transglutaminase-like domain-containing protein n=1 Tax=Pareuzebyella sediminis TaxID=2607998 RepID=UPI0011EF560E|nr:transglutaminase family protein [Pareuzebyella sediminis]